MNRSILIVICDFLVSAMLAMMTGMVPAHSGGTGVGLDETTTKLLLSELDAHRSELEKLRMHLKETIESTGSNPQLEAEIQRLTREIATNKLQHSKLVAKLNATPHNTGRLDEEELKKRLDEERIKRSMAEIELKDQKQSLAHAKDKLSTAKEQLKVNARDLAASRRDLSQTRAALAKTSEALVDMARTHVDTQQKLARAESAVEAGKSAIEQRNAEIRQRNEEIKRKTAELRISAARLSSAQGENKSIQSRLAYTTGQLRIRERDFAGLQDKLTKVEGQLMVEKLSAAEMRARSEELGKTLKTAVTQLSAANAELSRATKDKTIAETKLASVRTITEQLLKESSRKRSDVIASYANSVVNLTCRVSEEKFFGLHTGSGSFFLPVVDFKGRKLLVGTLNKFAGDANTALTFSKVKELSYAVQAPRPDALKNRIGSPILILPQEKRVAAFDYPFKDRKPLPLLTFEALKKRGLDGLYLFKCTSLGRDSALLDGRVSLSMVPGEYKLFIRNAGRANNELRAEPGDVILSREGDFVGIIMAHSDADSGRVRGAETLLFADPDVWKNADTIPVLRKPGSKYFSEFAEKMSIIRRDISADSRRRR